MVNPTYKHLEAKMRLGGLRLGQWLQLTLAVGFALAFGIYLSPLPVGPTIALAVFGAGLPVAISFAAMGLEFSVGSFLRAIWRWGRSPRRYLPGAGVLGAGYFVRQPESDISVSDGAGDIEVKLRLADLWD